jgi:two-component system, OmpR family, sensor histidine kinase CpxA
MRVRIFWKILFWFWLVFASVFSFNLFLTQVSSESARFRTLPPHLAEQLSNIEDKLTFVLDKNSRSNRKSRRFLRNAYLLDTNGNDYFGKRTPKLLLALHQQVLEEEKPMTVFKKRFLYFGGYEIQEQGKPYRLYVSQRFSFLSRSYLGFFIREFAQNLIISTFFISIPLSFLMAWFFTRPIKKLQLAISELSEDLNDKSSLEKLTSRSDEFGDLAKDFEQMTHHLDGIIKSKNQLLGDLSHELKTPLARLQLAIGLANQKNNESSIEEMSRIKLEADRMNQMITSVLDYSRTDRLSSEPHFNEFNLSELIESVVADAKFEAEAKNIKLVCHLQSDLSYKGDQTLILSCIENIIRNALRYSSSKIEINCGLQAKTQEEHSVEQESFIEIEICDDGNGIPESELEKVFEAFYRPQIDRSRESGGAGLGLSIAKKAVQVHQGEIFAQNNQPNGLKVSIRLPYHHQ